MPEYKRALISRCVRLCACEKGLDKHIAIHEKAFDIVVCLAHRFGCKADATHFPDTAAIQEVRHCTAFATAFLARQG